MFTRSIATRSRTKHKNPANGYSGSSRQFSPVPPYATRILLAVVVAAAGLLPLAAIVGPVAPAAAQGPWTVETIPVSGVLNDVTCVSGSDCWAVGNTATPDPLAELWNGTSWTQESLPNSGEGSLTSVTCVSAIDCWAVGYEGQSQGLGDGALTLNWNGTSWSQVTTPATYSEFLSSVTCVSSVDCWAVGSIYTVGSTNSAAVALQWNGTSWSQSTVPDPGTITNLSGVTCASSADCWAVGSYSNGEAYGTTYSLAILWNGSAWSQVTTPYVPGGGRKRQLEHPRRRHVCIRNGLLDGRRLRRELPSDPH